MRGDEWSEDRIDTALQSYAEPVEVPDTRVAVARVLERVRSESPRRRIGWWGFAVAATCFVMAAVFAAWILPGSRVPEIAWLPKPPGVARVLGTNSLAELPDHRARKAAHQNRAPAVESAQERLPKLDVFPTPRPLTSQEQALVAFAMQSTPEQKRQAVEAEKHLGDPIVIAELKIAPLDGGVVQDSKEQKRDKEK